MWWKQNKEVETGNNGGDFRTKAKGGPRRLADVDMLTPLRDMQPEDTGECNLSM